MAYETSDLYKEAIDSLSRVTFIDGDISTPNGEVIQITNDIIDQGSCYITNQCVSGDAFAYGSVFAAEAGITLDEIKTAMADREVYLADVKKRQDEYQASKIAGNAASVAKNSAAAGGFDF